MLCYKVHTTVNVTNVLLWVSICVYRSLNLQLSASQSMSMTNQIRISSLHLDCAVAGSLQMRKISVACENTIVF